MSSDLGRPAHTHYELRIEGHLDEHWATWFGALTLVRQADGTTVLHGPVTDQAELHGLLTKVRDLGATLILVRAVGATPSRCTTTRPIPGSSLSPHGRWAGRRDERKR